MSFSVNFHPLAKADYHAFYNYIAGRSPDGAVSWDNALDDAISRLETDPNIYGEIPDLVNGRDKCQQVFFKPRYGDRYRAVYVVDGEHVTITRHSIRRSRPQTGDSNQNRQACKHPKGSCETAQIIVRHAHQ